MKKTVGFVIALGLTLGLFAQDEKSKEERFNMALDKAIVAVDSAWIHPEQWESVANQFERLSNYKSDAWIPKYYQSLALIQFSWNLEKQEKEDAFEKVEGLIQAAHGISPGNVELLALEGYLYQAITSLNPMIKGPVYGPKSAQVLAQAIEIEPENPRAHFLLGQNTLHTPKMFGGGAEKALPQLEKAAELFELYQVENAHMPDWGAYMCDQLIAYANENR